ncbi:hypothetical protein PoB_003621300 [Plakobranchus ocellatus]|uniref:Uncharacterized protein n=1 Tax=Plakobranchus ocellatus TaxID=259542 RepID=A0AAV4ASC0_9GAST|nr:hypothetical protein PoB_003621300 [Plakobranchus ocellatus]
MSRMVRGGETRGGEGRGRERWRKRNNNAGGDLKGRKSGQEKSREGEERLRREERAGRKSAEDFGGEKQRIIKHSCYIIIFMCIILLKKKGRGTGCGFARSN